MSLLLLFSGGSSGSSQPTSILDDARAHEALVDLSEDELDHLFDEAKRHLGSIPLGLGNEELLRQVLDRWGSSPLAETIAGLAEHVPEDATSELVERLDSFGRKAVDSETPRISSEGPDSRGNAKAWAILGLIAMAVLGSSTALAIDKGSPDVALATIAVAILILMEFAKE